MFRTFNIPYCSSQGAHFIHCTGTSDLLPIFKTLKKSIIQGTEENILLFLQTYI